MQKCNFCIPRLEQGKQPSCVATCPGEALKFGPPGELIASAKKPTKGLSASTNPSFLISGRLKVAELLEMLRSKI